MDCKFILLLVSASFIGFTGAKYEGWPAEIVELLENEELRNWKPPALLADNYKYYQSGYNFEGKPVWIMEWGRYNMRKIIESKMTTEYDRYNEQMYQNLAFSLVNATAENEEYNPSLTVIIDSEGFTAAQMTSPETVSFILRLFRISLSKFQKLADKVYVIHAHFVVQNLISLLRPILGDVIEDVQIFGTDRSKWQARLTNDLPLESLPDWYGGKKDFKPIQVFG